MGDAVKPTVQPQRRGRTSDSAAAFTTRFTHLETDVMQTQGQTQTPAVSTGKLIVAAIGLLIGAAMLAHGVPRTASAASAFEALPTVQVRMHDGVEWSRVPAAPVDAGATVGAYDH
jgi:hypothetical protein